MAESVRLVIKRFPPDRNVTVNTKYGDFEVPYIFVRDNPVCAALEPYGNPRNYNFSVALLAGRECEFEYSPNLGWIAEHDMLEVAIVRFTKEEVGGEPGSKEYRDFILNSLCEVMPKRNAD
jgi:hypothetical protein